MMRLSGSVKFFWAFASGSVAGFPASLGFSLLGRLGLCFELGFGRRLRLRLQLGLGVTDLLGTSLLVGDPIRHLLAGLVAAVQLVLLGVRRLGRAEPCGHLGFQLRCALFRQAPS